MFGAETLPLSNGTVAVIKVVGDDIYVGGDFTNFAGIATADRIARWVGARQVWEGLAAFSALEGGSALDGSVTAGIVNAIEVSGSTVFVGGDFTVTTADNETHHNLAWFTIPDQTFNGYWHYDWHGFPGNGEHADAVWNGQVNAITEHFGALFVGGTFTDGFDHPRNDQLMVGFWGGCTTSVVAGCSASAPHVSACGGVTVACDAVPPNFWVYASTAGVGGFVTSITEDLLDGGVLVAGDFNEANGVTGATFLARFDWQQIPDWFAQGTVAGTMYSTALLEGHLYAAGWEGAYRRTGTDAWVQICGEAMPLSGSHWTSIVPISPSLVILASATDTFPSTAGIYSCNPETGAAQQISTNAHVVTMAAYRGELIVGGTSNVGGLIGNSDAIARFATPVAPLPPTDRDVNRNTNTTLLLITLTALTALAGTQLLRRN
jgi:hypothetical protein